jgi:hypothetical protein
MVTPASQSETVSKKLSEELKDSVVSDYLSGVTTREIIKKHKTYELYSILKERDIEYKQDNDIQKEKYKKIIELYDIGFKINDIVVITECKDVYKVLKKFGIKRKRNPKDYNVTKKEERNRKLIEDYLSKNYSMKELSLKYNMSTVNIYRIFKVYGIKPIKNKRHHWAINQKVKQTPNAKCKFYILEDYFGYTKIGITTQDTVRKRYKKNIKVFCEIDNTLEYCYHMEVKIKKLLKSYIPENIDKNIDGWSECYTISPTDILYYINLRIL